METYDWLFCEESETQTFSELADSTEGVSEETQEEPITLPDPSEPIWVTADKVKIPISKLTNRHIANILKLMERRNYRGDWKRILVQELTRRKAQELSGDFSL